MRNYNYTNGGYYFVTVCTKGRINYFGHIQNGVMCLNLLGSIIWQQWQWLHKQYPYVILDKFIVMPNHVHGIIRIERDCFVGNVGTGRDLSLQTMVKYKTKIKSLSELMGAFKTTSSKFIRLSGCPAFAWQRSFFDVIIKDVVALNQIQKYIMMNPTTWEKDKNNV